ncbi:DNA-methyltransferase [Parapedobacter koreensis]|uniref:Methyltransferase n=1 Tax=Parapedobacter koreensis TaxID=332977 RepID=A0A1H7UA01_9SPHI|nr:site-specific DNA-methyltransferase [Parapedobacter koreensis]SEL93833.1 DNA modification methylase [Parapedobacter koreensis]
MSISSTQHQIIIGEAAQKMAELKDHSVDLVVTSPPYPMIEMWDDIMANINPAIGDDLRQGDGAAAFERMHQSLDAIWEQTYRVLKPGGFACINIGDATRTINEQFALYANHSRIISAFIQLGFANMPNILWRKQTNAPNKFMGSGMLPAGAYVTLEHEWILVFRKAGKRTFKSEAEKQLRRESAFFWEERNTWFSDLWDLKGVKQKITNSGSRDRSAAYPFELPYRLINMYSVKGDTVLDPFLGTGTTALAAMATERNSVGIDIDSAFLPIIAASINEAAPLQLNQYIRHRIEAHKTFLQLRALDDKKSPIKHFNEALNLPVMTSQEIEIRLHYVDGVKQQSSTCYEVTYRGGEKAAHFEAPKRRGLQEVLPF